MEVSTAPRAKLGLVVACATHFLVGADGLAVAIALPHVQGTFGAAAIDTQWLLTGYAVTFASFMLLCGRLGDLYGRRRLLVVGMLLFTGGSLLAGVAPGLSWLVAGRVLQGLGAAAAAPATLALIGGLYPPGPARTRALSLLAAMTTIGVMSGLVLGGVVIDRLGWRWVFLLMVVPSAVTAVAAPLVLPETRAGQATRPDVRGAVLVSAGLVALLFGLTRIEHGAVAAALLSLLAGGVLLTAFAVWERRAPDPLMRFGILRVRGLRAASLGIGADGVAFTSIVYAGTLYLQNTLGYSPLRAALAILPLDLVAFVIALVAARFTHRSPRATLSVCFALTAVSLLWLARCPLPANYVVDLLPPLAVLGVSLQLVFIVTAHQAVADVAPDDKGLASGIYETSNHLLGGSIGVAVYAVVIAAYDYRAAFLAAAVLVVVLGTAAISQSGRTT